MATNAKRLGDRPTATPCAGGPSGAKYLAFRALGETVDDLELIAQSQQGVRCAHDFGRAAPTAEHDPLGVHTVASFILGAAVAMVGPGVGPARVWRFFVGLGACGGLTTFSTLAVKEVDDADSRSLGVGLAYLGATLALGLLGAAGGTVGVERMVAS